MEPTSNSSTQSISPISPDRTAASTTGSDGAHSPYRRDRFERRRRREAFHRKLQRAAGHRDYDEQKSDIGSSPPSAHGSVKLDLQAPSSTFEDGVDSNVSQKKRTLRARQLTSRNRSGITANLSSSLIDERLVVDHGEADARSMLRNRPQHHDAMPRTSVVEERFYRVVYRGVVALLTQPDSNASRSGAYLGYGEIFASSLEIPVDAHTESEMGTQFATGILDSPHRSVGSQHTAGSASSNDIVQKLSTEQKEKGRSSPQNPNHIIRVDRVVTGGYAVDAELTPGSKGRRSIEADDETPKRSNLDYYIPITAPSPMLAQGEEGVDVVHNPVDVKGLGFLFLRSKSDQIVEAMAHEPHFEEGRFQYRVVSSTPLPILAGPSIDAPRIKAMLLPGQVHDVSLRLHCDEAGGNAVWFLRLSHRRGWVAEKRLLRKNTSAAQWVTVMREAYHADDASSIVDDLSVVSSVASSSVITPTARQRHRPPRRKRDAAKEMVDYPPRHVGKNIPSSQATPMKGLPRNFDHGIMTPSSNVSILSDDSSLDRGSTNRRIGSAPTSPGDYSQTSSATSNTSNVRTASYMTQYYLMRVTAPRGLKILDTPQFQVSNLIRGKGAAASTNTTSQIETLKLQPKSHSSIFQTMSSRINTGGPGNPAIFDAGSKTRILPRGSLFEASNRMESTGAYSQGAGLVKLSDGSGWAVIPRQDDLKQQYRSVYGSLQSVKDGQAPSAYEEVGYASIDPSTALDSGSRWVRVISRTGISVSCPPPVIPLPDDETSPSSSRGSSGLSVSNHGSSSPLNDPDVASSVASTFVDAMMFRTPKKKGLNSSMTTETPPPKPPAEKQQTSTTIPCGMCVGIESFSPDSQSNRYARLLGGQGWVPLVANRKEVSEEVSRPDFRFGSFWFRVQTPRGIKVRLGPSKRAPSIKSEDGVYFRFECGEFLRASEIMTTFSTKGEPVDCFAKLYRNRHARFHHGHEEYRSLQSLTVQAEWVQVFSEDELYLEECAAEPRIERHKQGWRYNVVPDEGIPVRKGPSFSAETTGARLMAGESIVINERVVPAGEKITWLRMKEGNGWLHDVDDQDNELMIAHSLRHRAKSAVAARPKKPSNPEEEMAYNAIIARLFHNEQQRAIGRVDED